jgi:hypothetical protein
MSRFQRLVWPLLVVVAFACGAAWHISAAQEPKAAQKWEYQSVYVTLGDKTLQPLGDDGWEMVAAVWMTGTNHTVCYFKRPK